MYVKHCKMNPGKYTCMYTCIETVYDDPVRA